MQPNRSIKIFLASSDELVNDRNAFGNLVRRLDKIYEKRGIRIELFEWEDYDSAYNFRRKQDEYNDEVRASDMFIALFHKKAGKYTVEEFNVASEAFEKTGIKPKLYVYCRDITEGEKESAELAEFKRRLFEEMGHYWGRYGNTDTLCLHFVMQLQLVESSRLDDVKVEDGNITLEGQTIARMDGVPFAAVNPDYLRMSRRLAELSSYIEKARLRASKYPDDEDFQNELQRLLDERNHLQEEFSRQQTLLLDTAKRIAKLQGERITDRMRRAIDAFERGDVREANVILDEAERDADQNLLDYRRSKDVMQQKKLNVIHSIEELLLKTSTLMADGSLGIEERIERVDRIYAKANEMALAIEYDKAKHADLLTDYAVFLHKYGRYKDSLAVSSRVVSLKEELFGEENLETTQAYDNMGVVYLSMDDYPSAAHYFLKSLEIKEEILGENHLDTARSYDNIGAVDNDLGDYPHAMEYYKKALEIKERVLGKEHSDIASSYNSIGLVFNHMGDYPHAMEYFKKALVVKERIYGEDHLSTAATYFNIGSLFVDMGDYHQAREYYRKVQKTYKRVLGEVHPNTAATYSSIGLVYCNMGDYPKALECLEKSLAIKGRVFGEDHPSTAAVYINIGGVYNEMGDYPRALEYYQKGLIIEERTLGEEHPSTVNTYINIGDVFFRMGALDRAMEHYQKSLAICKQLFGEVHPSTAISYNNIGVVYHSMGDDTQALNNLMWALVISERIFGEDHPKTRSIMKTMEAIQKSMP